MKDNISYYTYLSPIQSKAIERLHTTKVLVKSQQMIDIIEILQVLSDQSNIPLKVTLGKDANLIAEHFNNDPLIPSIDTNSVRGNAVLVSDKLFAAYDQCYPTSAKCIKEQFNLFIPSLELDKIEMNIVDFKQLYVSIAEQNISVNSLELFCLKYKQSWTKFNLIDPFVSKAYLYTKSRFDELTNMLFSIKLDLAEIINDYQRQLRLLLQSNLSELANIRRQLYRSLDDNNVSSLRSIGNKCIPGLQKLNDEEFVNQISTKLEDWKSVEEEVIYREALRLNINNINDESLRECTANLQNWMNTISSLDLLNIEDDIMPHSYGKQLAKAREWYALTVFASNWIIEQTDYIDWRQFFDNLNSPMKKVVNKLLSLSNTERMGTITLLKIEEWKNSNRISSLPTSEDIVSPYFEAMKLWRELHNTNVKWLESTQGDSDFTVYVQDNWYCLSNTRETNIEELVVSDKMLYDTKQMTTYKHADKINQATKLAKAILSCTQYFNVYQSRDYNILSFASEVENRSIVKVLQHNGIKEFNLDDKQNLLIESIITADRDQILVVDDEVLNVRDLDNIIWQRQLIQSLVKSGYTLISLNTSDVLQGFTTDDILRRYLTQGAVAVNVAL